VNGEIHNCFELRHQLERKGYVFSSTSDAELVGALYLDKGEEFIKELNGLFVVAIMESPGTRSHSGSGQVRRHQTPLLCTTK
jgi:asparagine synthase (glutamine-hydrolysing)